MQVKAGEVEPELLAKAERILNRMERRLVALDTDYRDAKDKATGALQGENNLVCMGWGWG